MRKGSALIISMIFIALFSSLAFAMFALSSTNAQVASNYRQANRTLESAQSGLEVVRYLFSGLEIDGGLSSSGKLTAVHSELLDRIDETGVTELSVGLNTSAKTITLSSVTLDSAEGKSFECVIRQSDVNDNLMTADIIGTCKNLQRTIRVSFSLDEAIHTVFDYGIATRGPLIMTGQTSIDGANLAVESDVYIDTETAGNDFEIGNQASVGGDVYIVDPYASYEVGTKSSIGGETGTAALDHINVGATAVDFPVPNVDYFRQFATGDVIDSSTDISNYAVLDNVTIAANTNPTFASNVTIRGVLFVEQPNNVSFAGQSTIQGIIVGDSEPGESVGLLDFSGQVECFDVAELEGSQFEAISEESGTFIMAPGFRVDFSGQANIINGVIACSGARFTGLAGGQINGSIVNYSQEAVVLQGQSELLFNRIHLTEVPSGFEPTLTLEYGTDSYNEVSL